MTISSSTQTPPTDMASLKTEILKKAIDVDGQNIQKVLESANEQSKQITAQKTGIGNNLNIMG